MQEKSGRRISWVDVLLVAAVLAVLIFWWRVASQPQRESATAESVEQLMPTNIPLMTATITPTLAINDILVPTATLAVTPKARSDGALRHIVRGGETLLGIAGVYGVSVEDIQAANDLDDVLIRVGDQLIIPITRTDDGGAVSQVSSQFEYEVQSGDTVIDMAARFGSTVQDILQANSMSDNAILRPGDVLVIPVRQVPSEVLASTDDVTPVPTPSSQDRPFTRFPADAVYVAPRLIGPADGAVIGSDETVLLRWISVDVLEGNEWYVLLLYPVSGSAQNVPSIWTKSTSYRLGSELAPAVGESAEYAWQVSVVRVQPGVSSQYALEAASPPSELRSFTWK